MSDNHDLHVKIHTRALKLAMPQTREIMAANVLNSVFRRPRFDGHWMNEYKRELELAVQARAEEHEQQ